MEKVPVDGDDDKGQYRTVNGFYLIFHFHGFLQSASFFCWGCHQSRTHPNLLLLKKRRASNDSRLLTRLVPKGSHQPTAVSLMAHVTCRRVSRWACPRTWRGRCCQVFRLCLCRGRGFSKQVVRSTYWFKITYTFGPHKVPCMCPVDIVCSSFFYVHRSYARDPSQIWHENPRNRTSTTMATIAMAMMMVPTITEASSYGFYPF